MKKIKELGEKKLIDIIHDLVLKYWGERPLYDDAVYYQIGPFSYLFFHTDVLNYSTDYIEGMGFYNFGWKAVISNLSDIVCKGAKPIGMLASISLPEDMTESQFQELIKGICDALKVNGARYLGGDLSSSKELSIAGFVYGRGNRIILRSGSKEGHFIGVSGKFGLTSLAYKILFEKWEVPEYLKKRALQSVFKPQGRIKEAMYISDFIVSCMDISDGLAISLHQLADANNMGIEVNKIPIDEEVLDYCRAKGIDPLEFALYHGGEEYELLFTYDPKYESYIKQILFKSNAWFTRLGKFTSKREGVYFKNKEKKFEIERRGWEHFKYWIR